MENLQKPKRKTQTSYEVRKRWDKEHHKIYSVRLRLKDDADLIEYIESRKDNAGTSNIFREALKQMLEK